MLVWFVTAITFILILQAASSEEDTAVAVFARPATWSYDLSLLRQAAADEDELEAMMAAIALESQQLWVAESGEQPAAFAWTTVEGDVLRLLCLYVQSGRPALELLPPLLARIEEEHAGALTRLEIPAEVIHGVDGDILQAVGMHYEGETFSKLIPPRPRA